jgi:hypothetical protein
MQLDRRSDVASTFPEREVFAMFKGSCLCGAVAFEASDPIELRNCHCSRCRKARGAAFAANLFVPATSFRWLRGQDLVLTYRVPNAERFGNSFCKVCGSSIPRKLPTREVVLIPAGTLDDDPVIRTSSHIYVGSKAPWHEITDDVPQYPEGPPPA